MQEQVIPNKILSGSVIRAAAEFGLHWGTKKKKSKHPCGITLHAFTENHINHIVCVLYLLKSFG